MRLLPSFLPAGSHIRSPPCRLVHVAARLEEAETRGAHTLSLTSRPSNQVDDAVQREKKKRKEFFFFFGVPLMLPTFKHATYA
jgi:hypothetical protein